MADKPDRNGAGRCSGIKCHHSLDEAPDALDDAIDIIKRIKRIGQGNTLSFTIDTNEEGILEGALTIMVRKKMGENLNGFRHSGRMFM